MIVPREPEYAGRLLDGAISYAAGNRAIKVTELSYPVDHPDSLELPKPFPFDAALIWAFPEASWIGSLLDLSIPLISASGDIAPGLIPCLSFDHEALVDSAVDHLARGDPKTMIYLQFVTTGIPIKETRKTLFENAANRHSIPARSEEILSLESHDYNSQTCHQPLGGKIRERLQAIIKDLPTPSAIWCGDDILARRVCEVAPDLGLQIPRDLMVLGLGDFRVARSGDQSLSTIPLPGETIGYRGLSVLNQRLSGRADFPNYIAVLAPPVIIRDSTLFGGSGDLVSRALALIAERACQNLSVRQVAKELSLSPQTFHSRFVERVGHSPGEEIRRVKLGKAKSYLRDPQVSISEVASLVGYSEQNKLSQFFKRETGMSPMQWRKKNG